MHRRLRWLVVLSMGLLVLLASGCDELRPQESSPSAPAEAAQISAPTRTLGPIVSYTPRFTATPVPSITPTPSDTPIASETPIVPTDTPQPPTPTPSLTPTVTGIIRSSQTVNLREGPGTSYPVVANVRPGTEVGVVGLQTDARGGEWYKVAYDSGDGETLLAWVLGSLLNTSFKTAQAATPVPVGSGGTVAAGDRVEILAYCQQKGVRPPRVTTDDSVFIEWSWYVARQELMEEHLTNANYRVRLDGKLLTGWEGFATPIRSESGRWIVYWYYPVGTLEAGQHRIEFEVSWDQTISDGYRDFGPGTSIEVDAGNCSFTVIES